MPVQKIDMLIGAVLALGLVGSVVGTILYEEVPSTLPFDVTWTVSEGEIPPDEETQTGGGTTEFTFLLTQANLTGSTVEVVVSSSSARTQPRSVTVTVDAPNATQETRSATLPAGASNSVTIEVPITFAQTPNATQVEVGSIDEARQQVNRTYATTNGTGEWTVTVEIQGEPVMLANPTYQIELGGAFSYFTGEIDVATPDINR